MTDYESPAPPADHACRPPSYVELRFADGRTGEELVTTPFGVTMFAKGGDIPGVRLVYRNRDGRVAKIFDLSASEIRLLLPPLERRMHELYEARRVRACAIARGECPSMATPTNEGADR